MRHLLFPFATRRLWPRLFLALAGGFFVTGGAVVHAGNLGRGGAPSLAAGSSTATVSQTSTTATAAAAQAAQSALLTARAQMTMQRSMMALHALEAQQNAQNAARNLILSGGNATANAIPNGIATGGLMPAQAPTATTTVATVTNPDGTSSVTLNAGTAITLPAAGTGTDQITVSGTGTVGSVTSSGTITPLTAGTATTIAPGSTISLTQGGTISFASGSAEVPANFSSFTFGSSSVPSSWTGVSGLTQSTYSSGASQNTAVTVTQSQQQALLDWQTFNVGTKTTLDFDQSAGGANVSNWIVFNKVAADVAPSQIFGAIQAPGQVYIINQNGIIFGGSSQVNAGALVASSLPINDNLVQNGLLNNPDYQFLFSQVDEGAGTLGPTPAFQPEENDPAPGAHGSSGGVIAHVDAQGNLSLVSASGLDGDVVVQPGAQLTSPATATHTGGKIALVGPNVTNAGTISTPDGQTILAAGVQVGFEAHNSNDPSLRGLDAYVGDVTDPSVTNPAYATGAASNTGLIGTLDSSGDVAATPGADFMMTGAQVDQLGSVDLSTSVNLNSRVDLLADYGAREFISGTGGFSSSTGLYPTESGTVTLGASSLTSLTPDLSSTDTVVGTTLALPSLVDVQGQSIDMQANALLLAPSAALPASSSQPALGLGGNALTAGVTFAAGGWDTTDGTQLFLNTTGQVTLEQNAIVDVSGSENVAASVDEDIVAVQLLGSELANSPLQQNSPLRGQTVYVDLRNIGVYDGTAWIGTPLADASGYVNLVQHDIGELTAAGGTVSIAAGNAVTMQSGATVDVSGGWINYAGGMVQTTNVVANGRIINISQATPNLVYSGIYDGYTATQAKYGLSETYTTPSLSGMQYDPGYIQGANGGSLSISAPSLSLNGTLSGSTAIGAQQRNAASVYTSASSAYAGTTFLPTILETLAVPTGSELKLSLSAETSAGSVVDPTTPQNIDIGSTGAAGDLVLSNQLLSSAGFGSLSINDPTGNFTLEAGAPLTLAVGGSLGVIAANIDLESDITGADGTLSFTALGVSPNVVLTSTNLPAPTASSPAGAVSATGNFNLGPGIVLEAGGLVADDSSSTIRGLPELTNGGSIKIDGYSVFLRSGSTIDASGGAYVSAARAVTYGKGGSIVIEAGQDPNNGDIDSGKLLLGATLSAYSGVAGGGGSLTLKAPLVQIGGALGQGLQNGDLDANVVAEGTGVYGNGNTLWLDPTGQPDFFSQGGFESYTIQGVGEIEENSSGVPQFDSANDPLFDPAVLIAPGIVLKPTVLSQMLTSQDVLVPYTSGQNAQLLPSERSPVNLTFDALGVVDSLAQPAVLEVMGNIVMDAGSVMETDPQAISNSAGVSFSAPSGTVAILGSVIAPGGTITVTGSPDSRTLLFTDTTDALATVELGSQSLLSTAGAVEYTLNSQGYTTGSVLNGGTITIKGNIVAEAGSTLDVSGAGGTLDVQPSQASGSTALSLNSPAEVPLFEASNAGSITMSGNDELFTEATLLGNGGGPSAQGGRLTLSSGSINAVTPLDATLAILQEGTTFVQPVGDVLGKIVTPSHSVLDPGSTTPATLSAYFAADPNIFAAQPVAGDTGNGGRAGGFQSLTLNGTVDFAGPVSIVTGGSITVGGSSGGILYANAGVVLDAPEVTLGRPFSAPSTPLQAAQTDVFDLPVDPTYGTGTLTVDASTLIQIGNLSLQDIGTVDFNTTLANTPVAVVAGIPIPVTGNGTITSTVPGTITSANGSVTTLPAGVATAVTAGSSITLNGSGSITPTAAGIIPSSNAGDIVGDGTFDVAGTLAMTAAQLYPPTESYFSIFDYDYNNVTGNGSVIFTRPLQSNTLPSLPLSAGGVLNVYASNITQDGVLRAPDGTINLGISVSGAAPVDYLTGSDVAGSSPTGAPAIPASATVTLGSASVTSVSLVDPNTGEGITVPYGIVNASGDWIDPAGNDITTAGNTLQGLPAKAVNVSGQAVVEQAGSTLDLRGGGDLFAYEFVSGTGGTNDILASTGSFAVIPGYSTAYQAYAPYATSTSLETNGVADAGYSNPGIASGSQIYLNAGSGLPAGVYTVLPARYALLAGAYLITPASTGVTPSSEAQPDGTTYVTGYRFSGLTNSTAAPPLYTEYEVQSQATVLTRADYQVSDANTFFPQAAATSGVAVPRLPMDAGQLVLAADSLSLPGTAGSLLDSAATGGLGGEVDIASSGAINIDNAASAGTIDTSPGALNLDSTELTDFGAGSLLIGGYRLNGAAGATLTSIGSALLIPSSGGSITFPEGTPGDDTVTVSGSGVVGSYTTPSGSTSSITGGSATALPAGSVLTLSSGGTVTFSQGTGGSIPVRVAVSGTGVAVTTSAITVNNAGASLSGTDIILASNGSLTVDAGSSLTATANSTVTEGTLSLVGDGALVRVSSDPTASISRVGVQTSGNDPSNLQIESAAGEVTTVSGGSSGSIVLDSTNQTTLASTKVNLAGASAALDSGQITIELTVPGTAPVTTGLILSGAALANLQADAHSLSLLSYSSIDLYNGALGTPGVIGGAESGGVSPIGSLALHATDLRGTGGGDVVINAQSVDLDNSSGGAALGAMTGSTASGTLTINAQTISLGMNTLQVDQFADVDLNAGTEVALTGLGTQGSTDTTVTASAPVASGLLVVGNLSIDTPLITGSSTAASDGQEYTSFVDEAITAQGALTLTHSGTSPSSATASGLGADLQLSGASLTDNTDVVLHGGTAGLTATSGNLTVGTGAVLDVSGPQENLYNLSKYPSGGAVTLTSVSGDVNVGGTIDVSAASGVGTTDSLAGKAGSLTINAPNGTLLPGGTIEGQAGLVTSAGGTLLAQGDGGSFSLNVGTLGSGGLDQLEALLNPSATGPTAGDTYVGGFTQSQSILLHNGSLVIDGTIAAENVNLSTDNGFIEITSTGRIDATAPQGGLIDTTTVTQTENGEPVITLTHPGAQGGTITLAAGVTPGMTNSTTGLAYGSVVLDSGSMLSAAGQYVNDAGEGGAITLQAGADVDGTTASAGGGRLAGNAFASGTAVVNVQSGATIDLSVDYLPIQLDNSGASSVTLAAAGAIYFPQGTPGNDELSLSSAGTVTSATGITTSIAAGTPFTVAPGATLQVANGGSVLSFVSGGAGGAVTLDLPFSANFTSVGATNLAGDAALTAASQGDRTGTLLLEAPQTANNSDVQVDPINGAVLQAASVTVAGLYVQNADTSGLVSLDGSTSPGGTPANVNYETQAISNAQTFTGNYTAIAADLIGPNAQGVAAVLEIEPAEEIDNTAGGLILNNTWDLSQNRFGPSSNLPGLLTVRAAGDLDLAFGASLTDGFNTATATNKYLATLMSGLSWSYDLVAGADFSAANAQQVTSGDGSFVLGLDAPALPTTAATNTQSILRTDGFYQAIRTGTGSITIDAGTNVEIENELATIYTAGTAVSRITGFTQPVVSNTPSEGTAFRAQYNDDGGNVAISAQGNIGHYTANGTADSSDEMPTTWLYREGSVTNGFYTVSGANVKSTSWWIDFGIFYDGVGALGGGNVSVTAGGNVVNLDASVPTNAEMPGTDSSGNPLAASAANLVELGGGDITIQAGLNIDAGVYYVEKGAGTLTAGNEIVTNSTRAALTTSQIASAVSNPDSFSWLPTTLFVGDASFDVSADGSVLLGPVANPFLLPQNIGNGTANRSYFSTYNTADAINVASTSGSVTIQDDADAAGAAAGDGSLFDWYSNVYFGTYNGNADAATTQPWLQILETNLPNSFADLFGLMPSTLRATAYSGNIDLLGTILVSPSPTGTINLAAAGSVNGFQPNTESSSLVGWGSTLINLSDANPASIPGVASPISSTANTTSPTLFVGFDDLFNESGATQGLSPQEEATLHADINGDVLHANDSNPLQIYAGTGDVSGITLYSGKFSDIVAGGNIQDVALYIQNANANEITVVDAGGQITAYDSTSLLRTESQVVGNVAIGETSNTPLGAGAGLPNTGDIQISGPGTLEVLAGGTITLGDGPVNTSGANGTSNGTDTGITSVGDLRNPFLPSTGANIIVGAGLGGVTAGMNSASAGDAGLSGANPATEINFAKFEDEFLNPDPADPTLDPDNAQADRYLPDLGTLMNLPASDTPQQIWTAFNSGSLSAGQRDALALQVYYLVLRDAGRDHNTSSAAGAATYQAAYEAIAGLFPSNSATGNILLSSREITTVSGGDISLFAPNGGVTVGFNLSSQPVDQGILTEGGGNISIYTQDDVNLGTSRIFTLDGGNIIILSSQGSIDAGASSKTVQSAPPTRVLVSTASAAVETDLAGLATGGGIGVLESQAGAQAGDVDLIAPQGTINAGDAGIRVSGNLNLAAVQVLNSGNISVGGKSSGVPTTSSPNLAGLSAASSAAGGAQNAASNMANQQQKNAGSTNTDLPSIITVQVIGYGGGDAG